MSFFLKLIIFIILYTFCLYKCRLSGSSERESCRQFKIWSAGKCASCRSSVLLDYSLVIDFINLDLVWINDNLVLYLHFIYFYSLLAYCWHWGLILTSMRQFIFWQFMVLINRGFSVSLLFHLSDFVLYSFFNFSKTFFYLS